VEIVKGVANILFFGEGYFHISNEPIN